MPDFILTDSRFQDFKSQDYLFITMYSIFLNHFYSVIYSLRLKFIVVVDRNRGMDSRLVVDPAVYSFDSVVDNFDGSQDDQMLQDNLHQVVHRVLVDLDIVENINSVAGQALASIAAVNSELNDKRENLTNN